MPGGFLHPSGRPSGGRAADDVSLWIVLLIDVQNGLLDHGFAGAGAAGDDGQALGQGCFDGSLLFCSKADFQMCFLGRDLLIDIHDGRSSVLDTLCKDFFCQVLFQPGGALPIDEAEIRGQPTVRQHTGGAVGQHLLRQLRRVQEQQAGGNEFVLVHAQVAFALRVSQGE